MFFGPGYIQRCMFAFITLTILSCIVDGAWIGAGDYGVIKTLTFFEGYGPIWKFPLIAAGFMVALPQMVSFDYSFFNSLGSFGMICRLVLFGTIGIGFVWGFATMLWPIIANFTVNVVRGIGGVLGKFF